MRSWLSRVRNVFRADAIGDDIDREMAFHLAEREEQLVASGMNRSDARHEARRLFGNVGIQKDATRERDLFGPVESIVADVRYALRGLRAAPGFTLVTILSLALGIGANTAIFTFINVAMLKSIPVSHPEELVEVTIEGGQESKGGSRFSRAMWEYFRERQDIFASVLAYTSTGSADLSTGGEARPIPVGLVSGSFFSTLGTQPAAGRLLVDSDDQPGCEGVIVLSHTLWKTEFGSDPAVVGKRLPINEQSFEVVGVAEAGFIGLSFGYYPPVWMPQCAGIVVRGRDYQGGGVVVARMKEGATLAAVNARLSAFTPAMVDATTPPNASAEVIERHRRTTVRAEAFRRGFTFLQDDYGDALQILMALVAVVLLVACANTANLLFARATARRREMAMRLALGASRTRLIRQLLTESMLLALGSAAVGMLFAAWGSRLLVNWLSPRGEPVLRELSPDVTVLLFTVGAAVVTALVFGLAPAWRAVGVSAQTAFHSGERGVAEGASRFNVGKALVVAQLALSLMLVSGASLLVGSWRRLATINPGFRSEGVLLVGVNARPSGLPDAQRSAAFAQILERLRALPGVMAASTALRTPIGTTSKIAIIDVPGVEPNPVTRPSVMMNNVSDRHFATLGTRLVRGRDFNSGDRPGSRIVAIVSEETVRQFFGGRDAVGERFRFRGDTVSVEIVGVVEDSKDQSLRETAAPQLYLASSQMFGSDMSVNFEVRSGQLSATRRSVSDAILAINPRFALTTRTLQEQVDDSLRLTRTLGMLSGFFGSLALLLASVGLYGIVSYGVARRRNEIGVRVALGAKQRQIVRMIVSDVGRIVIAGVVIGLALSLAATKTLSAFLFGVQPDDPVTFALSAAALIAVGCTAAIAPARRAARLDPVTALREE